MRFKKQIYEEPMYLREKYTGNGVCKNKYKIRDIYLFIYLIQK